MTIVNTEHEQYCVILVFFAWEKKNIGSTFPHSFALQGVVRWTGWSIWIISSLRYSAVL